MIVAIIAILVLAIYAVIITYLYLRQKKRDEKRFVEEGKVDMKINDVKERLKEVERMSYPEKIDIEEERER